MWQEFQFGEPAIEPVLPKNPERREIPEYVKKARELRENKWYAFALRVAGLSHMHIDTLWNKGYRRGDDERLEQQTFSSSFEETNSTIRQLCEEDSTARSVYVTESEDYNPQTAISYIQFYIANNEEEVNNFILVAKLDKKKLETEIEQKENELKTILKVSETKKKTQEELENLIQNLDLLQTVEGSQKPEYLKSKFPTIMFENNRVEIEWENIDKKIFSRLLYAANAKSFKYKGKDILHVILSRRDSRTESTFENNIYLKSFAEFESRLKKWDKNRSRVWGRVNSVLRGRNYREMTPEKTDWMVFSPELASHMEEGFTMVTTRWKHLGLCRLEEFVAHPKISTLFAHLVMLLMRNNAFLTQRRYMLQKTYRLTNQRIQKIMYLFKFVKRDGRRLKIVK